MNTRNQSGAIDKLLLPLITVTVLLIGVTIAAVWAYGQRQDYKNNVDAKIGVAVTAAKQAEDGVKEKDFAERDKNPLKTYTGPSAYGSLVILYPRTWSGYVSDSEGSDPFVDGYFSPGVVPSVTNEKSSFALRVQVMQQSYSEVMDSFSSQQEAGTATVQPYALPKVPNIVGSRITGEIVDQKQGVMIVLPIRDKTLEIWTESNQFVPDFDNIILANFSFSP